MAGDIPPQLSVMRSLIGTQWSSGPPSPTILAWEELIATTYPEMASYIRGAERSYIAWCGLTVAYCLTRVGIKPVFGSTDTDKFLWARAWLTFGLAVTSPMAGDVMVFDFGGGDSHVTLYNGGGDDSHYECLGGNQSHQVKISNYAKSQCVGIRRPPGASIVVPAPEHPEIKTGATGPAVTELQRLLGVEQDGEFGPATDAAVRAAQLAHGLDPDGEVGPLTWAALTNSQDDPISRRDIQTSKGSWYSQYQGKYTWHDSGDTPGSAALGVPDDAQGIARPGRDTLGTWFMVRAPNGKTSIEQQTDLGPAAFTGRTIDISSAAAERFGYSPQNFPTDGIFTFWPAPVPPEVAGLSKQNQAIHYRDIRKGLPAPTVPATPQRPPMTDPVVDPPKPPVPQPQLSALLPTIDVTQGVNYILNGMRDKVRDDLLTFVHVFDARYPDVAIGTQPAPAIQPVATSPATATPIQKTPAFQVGMIGVGASTIVHLLHLVDPEMTIGAGIISAAAAFLGPTGSVIAGILTNLGRAAWNAADQPQAKQ